ncbi:MAG: outer membrane protein transport protein [Proteobacteria bacterium]|nr:outer membrane protein transport protein [Pseudomonadota bacterium]
MMQKKFQKRSRFLPGALALTVAATMPATAMAAGFQLTEQSVTGLGRAFAGSAAFAEDASTVFYNPAGLTELDREVLIGGSLIALGADLDRTVAVDASGQPLTGGEGGDVGKLGGVPILYYSQRVNDDWVFGLGVNAPFGLATDYDPDWIGRYQGVYSQVSTLNINPSLGWEVNDNWSLGFGLSAMHFRVKLTNMVDYGAVCYGAVNPVTCSAIGLTPQSHDGYAEIEGDSWGFGFNLGAMWKNDTTRIGFHYRSRVSQDLEGDSRFENAPALFTATNRFINQGITAEFETPETISLSLVHDINEDWTFSADVTRTGWDTFESIVVNYDNYDPATGAGQPPTIQPENWEDVMRYSVGLDWRYSEAFTFRGGLALDQSPISDEYRTVRLPGDDRTWLSFGATWHVSEAMEMAFGYAHLFIDDEIPFAETGSQGDTIAGTYEASADIVGAELRYRF